jgi:hypothetical protein
MFVAAGIDILPSISVTAVICGGLVSLKVSITGVAASVPVPVIGQMFGKVPLSNDVIPEARFVVHVRSCQSGELSFKTPKFDPPVTSR